MRDDIAEKKFRINVKMKADKIQVFYIKGLGLGAWVENHLRVLPSENHNMSQWVSKRPK